MLSTTDVCVDAEVERANKVWAEFAKAVKGNKVDAVRQQLAAGDLELNANRGRLAFALLTAVQGSCVDVVKELLKHGALPRCPDAVLRHALKSPCAGEMLALLFGHGARLVEGVLSAVVGQQRCKTGVLDVLLRKATNVEVNEVGDSTGMTPLMEAAAALNVVAVAALLERGARVDDVSERRKTALHYAAGGFNMGRPQNPKMQVVQLLMHYGALRAGVVDIIDVEGNSALGICLGRGDLDVSKMLVEHGTDVNAGADSKGNTPLHVVAATNGRKTLCEAMVQRGANVFARNRKGKTPLEVCSEDMKELLEQRADRERLTTLLVGMSRVRKTSVRRFSEHSAFDVNVLGLVMETLTGRRAPRFVTRGARSGGDRGGDGRVLKRARLG